NGGYDILLPVRSTVTPLVAENEEELSRYANFVITSKDSMEIANNKEKTFKFAEKIGIPIPKTFYPRSMDEVELAVKELSFPVVIKASHGAGSRGVFYVNTHETLFSFFNNYFSSSRTGETRTSMIQELIWGGGYGFFSIFNQGEPRAIFMHKRIREYPITGGPSTVAESYYNPRLKELGLKLLKELKWNGVAMVEFKKDVKDDEFKLMEINPKFWGSLNLAIASGVDFPYLFCLQAMKERYEPVFEYKKGVKFRWLFPGDFMNLLAHYGFSKDFYKDFFDKNVCYDISASDIKPNILELFLVAGYFIQNKGKIRYPQGKPLLRKKI
ncbi:MAG: ATP-grasp domain-containing protein, partial [candidate division Zixibacteria bacterium]|nr:ATP-grasp domain-containing protein [candidate division Zixibacteria bacterium]